MLDALIGPGLNFLTRVLTPLVHGLRRRRLLTESWVEDQLIALRFDERQVRENLKLCMRNLQDHGILDERAGKRFFRDKRTKALLEDIYRRDLRRTAGALDPVGYCLWGVMLHRASRWDRDMVETYVRNRVRDFHDHGAK